MRRSLPGADDPNAIVLVASRISVNDQNDGDQTNHPYRVPPLLAVLEPIGQDDMQGIIPNRLRELEGYAMLGEVPPRLFRIPIELHESLVLTETYAQKLPPSTHGVLEEF